MASGRLLGARSAISTAELVFIDELAAKARRWKDETRLGSYDAR